MTPELFNMLIELGFYGIVFAAIYVQESRKWVARKEVEAAGGRDIVLTGKLLDLQPLQYDVKFTTPDGRPVTTQCRVDWRTKYCEWTFPPSRLISHTQQIENIRPFATDKDLLIHDTNRSDVHFEAIES